MLHTMDRSVATFHAHRGLLFDLAYRMVGSASDAEDLVQEAWLRWQRAPRDAITSPKAWLCTALTRLAIDHLRSARVRREQYVGPWLPEPLVTDMSSSPPAQVALAESLSLAFMSLLERLAPVERAVFLLREVFEIDYEVIAEVVDKTPANCRQIFRRAKERLAGRPRFEPDDATHTRLLTTFLSALGTGDIEAFKALLADEVTLWSDGGGVVTAARNPIYGADRVARFLFGLYKKAGDGFGVRVARVNGLPGLVLLEGERVFGTYALQVEGGRVVGIRMVLNPAKLGHVDV